MHIINTFRADANISHVFDHYEFLNLNLKCRNA